MHPLLSEEQQCLVELVRTLGRDRFAARAHRHDSEASFPVENYADLREAGLLALTIPKRHGGLGADYTTYTLVSAELGRWCGATALTFNMHACSTLWPGLLADDLEMTAEVRKVVDVPLIASGGAGAVAHFPPAVAAGADAVLAASVFHFGVLRIQAVKEALRDAGYPVRL